jgi:hypothetical protein
MPGNVEGGPEHAEREARPASSLSGGLDGLGSYGVGMPGLPLATLQSRLAAYLAAETKILGSQAYTVDGLASQRASLAEVRKAIDEIQTQIDAASGDATDAGPIVVDFGDPGERA